MLWERTRVSRGIRQDKISLFFWDVGAGLVGTWSHAKSKTMQTTAHACKRKSNNTTATNISQHPNQTKPSNLPNTNTTSESLDSNQVKRLDLDARNKGGRCWTIFEHIRTYLTIYHKECQNDARCQVECQNESQKKCEIELERDGAHDTAPGIHRIFSSFFPTCSKATVRHGRQWNTWLFCIILCLRGKQVGSNLGQ